MDSKNETSKYWRTLLNELKNRGVEDVLIFAIDGLNGFTQAIQAVYPKAEICPEESEEMPMGCKDVLKVPFVMFLGKIEKQ